MIKILDTTNPHVPYFASHAPQSFNQTLQDITRIRAIFPRLVAVLMFIIMELMELIGWINCSTIGIVGGLCGHMGPSGPRTSPSLKLYIINQAHWSLASIELSSIHARFLPYKYIETLSIGLYEII